MLSGIRQIKLFAYEGYFEEGVLGYREKELARLRDRKRDRSTMDMVTVSWRIIFLYLARPKASPTSAGSSPNDGCCFVISYVPSCRKQSRHRKDLCFLATVQRYSYTDSRITQGDIESYGRTCCDGTPVQIPDSRGPDTRIQHRYRAGVRCRSDSQFRLRRTRPVRAAWWESRGTETGRISQGYGRKEGL